MHVHVHYTCTFIYYSSQTDYKQVSVCAQFPLGYPSEPLLLELKSKTIAGSFIDSLIKVCDQELKKHLQQKQV